MQLPIFNPDPKISTLESPDAWIRKLSVEVSQLCATCYTTEQLFHAPKTTKGTVRSNITHPHHPITKWVNLSLSNWFWCLDYGLSCIEESMNHRKLQKTAYHLPFLEWCLLNPPDMLDLGLTDFVKPKGYERFNVDQSYQQYFLAEKQHIAKWTNRDIPDWYIGTILT